MLDGPEYGLSFLLKVKENVILDNDLGRRETFWNRMLWNRFILFL